MAIGDACDQGEAEGPHEEPHITHTEITTHHVQERARAISGMHSFLNTGLATQKGISSLPLFPFLPNGSATREAEEVSESEISLPHPQAAEVIAMPALEARVKFLKFHK